MSSNLAGSTGADGESATGSPEEVVDPAPRPVRRSFTAAYRARLVAEYEAAPRGKKGGVLRAENRRLTRELAKSQAVVEIMGKLQGLLDATSESTATPSTSTRR